MNRSIVPAALVAAVVLGACGQTGDDASEPTRAEFVATVDRTCRASNARTRTLNEELQRAASGTRTDKQLLRRLAPVLERAYGPIRDNAAALQAANPPAGDAAEVERIRKLYDEQAELARELADAADRGDIADYLAADEHRRTVVRRVRSLTKAFGFRECGSTKSDPRD